MKGKLGVLKGKIKEWQGTSKLSKGRMGQAEGRTHSPLAIKQAITANHRYYSACQEHHPSWQVHHRIAYKQKKYGIG